MGRFARFVWHWLLGIVSRFISLVVAASFKGKGKGFVRHCSLQHCFEGSRVDVTWHAFVIHMSPAWVKVWVRRVMSKRDWDVPLHRLFPDRYGSSSDGGLYVKSKSVSWEGGRWRSLKERTWSGRRRRRCHFVLRRTSGRAAAES